MPDLNQSLKHDVINCILSGGYDDLTSRQGWLYGALPRNVVNDLDIHGSAHDFAVQVALRLDHDQLISALRRVNTGDTDAIDRICAQIEQSKLDSLINGQPNPLLRAYRQRCIQRWQDERYHADKDFVRLVILRHDETRGLIAPENAREYNDLRDARRDAPSPVMVLLGAPGSGKTTLLRRLQTDDAQDRLADNGPGVSFFAALNEFPEDESNPRVWLAARWRAENPGLGDFDRLFEAGRFLFLLDGLNELPLRQRDEYSKQVAHWRRFATQLAACKNQAVFTCRSLEYSFTLSSDNTPVPQITVKPMTPALILEFLNRYLADEALAGRVFARLKDDARLLELYGNPFFLSLMVKQVSADGSAPQGQTGLITNFVRAALARELGRESSLLQNQDLLSEEDRIMINTRAWRGYNLPEGGALLPQITALAWHMRQNELLSLERSMALACLSPNDGLARQLVKAGQALNILDKADGGAHPIKFFHQLFLEYFAARQMTRQPDTARFVQKWKADETVPSLRDTLAQLAPSDPLPVLATSGWEETARMAAPMMPDPAAFVRSLMPVNLPLAGRLACAPDVHLPETQKDDLRLALVARTQDTRADLRARIAAGLALGALGDPRYTRGRTASGKLCLAPPMARIPGGVYPIGDNKSAYPVEKPAHTAQTAQFEIALFPVTNAEYACFMQDGGYANPDWWDTPPAKRWLEGDTSAGPRKRLQDMRAMLKRMSEKDLRALEKQNRATPKQVQDWLTIRGWSDAEFENWLDENYPHGKLLRQPAQWDDPAFNAPSHPVVGVCWHEAWAYARWLSAQTRQDFRLPSELEWEAAARGKRGRAYAYEGAFDPAKANTLESSIRATTPVGVYPPSPEGVYDLTGNVWEWTSSAYLPYPYLPTPDREDPSYEADARVLRGGSWSLSQDLARAAYRGDDRPTYRSNDIGFRLARFAPVP